MCYYVLNLQGIIREVCLFSHVCDHSLVYVSCCGVFCLETDNPVLFMEVPGQRYSTFKPEVNIVTRGGYIVFTGKPGEFKNNELFCLIVPQSKWLSCYVRKQKLIVFFCIWKWTIIFSSCLFLFTIKIAVFFNFLIWHCIWVISVLLCILKSWVWMHDNCHHRYILYLFFQAPHRKYGTSFLQNLSFFWRQ